MTDLILHVGLSKAGSTTLQKHFFSNFYNFIGYHSNKKCLDTNYLVSELEDLYYNFEFNEHDHIKCKQWAEKVRSLNENNFNSHFKELILSREHLTGWRGGLPSANGRGFLLNVNSRKKPIRERPSPTAQFIKYLKNDVWIYGNVRVVFTLRNQPEWLASQYSQTSNRIINASQKNFEEQIDYLIKTRDPYLDWSEWIKEFYDILGSDNVCVLLQEEMHKEYFWNKLGCFVNVDSDIIKEIFPQTFVREKKRSTNTYNTWELRKFDPYFYIKTIWPRYKLPLSRKYILKLVKFLQKYNIPFAYNTFSRMNESHIYLTEDIKHKIYEYVSPYNRKLELLINRHISHLGY